MAEASGVGIVMVVRFRTRLDPEEFQRRYRARMPRFRELPGLVQKHYFHDDASDEWGGVYLWESEEAMQRYLASDLRGSIAEAYEVDGAPQVQMLRVVEDLRT